MQSIGIVGGGKGGLRLLHILSSSTARVAFVVDLRDDAPAVVAARQARVAVFTDAAQAIAATSPDLVFEVTGSDRVAADVRKLCAGKCEVIAAETVQAILDSIDESFRALAARVVADVGSMKGAIDSSLTEMATLLDTIDDITGNMQMLALNARIEAARVGEAGRGFAVVAQEMAGSTDSIRQASRQLDQLNGSIKGVADGLDAALRRLT